MPARLRAVLMSNDAKGCYDRIAHIVVHLALMCLGIPKPALDSMIECIQEMEHYIRTAFGISDDYYGNEPTGHKPQGLLQGNGAAPAGWSSLISPVIKEMKKAGFGYHQWSIICKRALAITCFAFVDDTDLIHCSHNPNVTSAQLIQEAQQALFKWEGLIWATGSDLAPEKSYWYLVDVRHHKGKWKYVSATKAPGDLYLRDGSIKIELLGVNQAREFLRIQVRSDGKMHDEFKYLKRQAAEWADALPTKKVKDHEAWYCLNSTIMKTLSYPMLVTTFTREQIDAIMKPILKIALNKSSIQKWLPRKLLYGSLRTRGMNVQDLYQLQLIYKLQSILRHTHQDTPTHDLQNENMELLQLHVGSQQNFWDLPFPMYDCLALEGWTKFAWKWLSDSPLSLKGPTITVPMEREHDQYLMDVFASLGYADDALVALNDCRLYLQVTLLSHISTADRHRIEQRAWDGKDLFSRTDHHWIGTHLPSPKCWKLWRTALHKRLSLCWIH